MSVDPKQLQVGMEVLGTDGEFVGTVKSIAAANFVLNRPWSRDLIVPLEAVRAIVDTSATHSINAHVVLVMRAHSVDAQGWDHVD
jgi:hypothetical protein